MHVVEPLVEEAPIDIDVKGVAVRNVRAHPWQTVVLSEEGARELQGGIVLEGSGVQLTLKNKTPYTLEHVILHPSTDATAPAASHYFSRVKPGESVTARDGLRVERSLRPTLGRHGSPLDESPMKKDVRASEVMDALEALIKVWAGATYPPLSPLPVARAMATALVELPTSREAGYGVERDVVFLRVIGLGGGKGKGELDPDKKTGKEREL